MGQTDLWNAEAWQSSSDIECPTAVGTPQAMELRGRRRKCSWGHRRNRGGMKGRRAK